MCRMFGVVAAQPVALHAFLWEGSRSLAALSSEHSDGWGVAVHDASAWSVEKRPTSAGQCPKYREIASTATAAHAIAHIRKKTVGETKLSNTHPFRRDRFVFAHNGTMPGVATLLSKTSRGRLAEIAGDTDSERLFAFLLTSVDDAPSLSEGVARAAAELRLGPAIGSASFLFSDGERMFAFRQGRTLFAMAGERATFVASEPLTSGAWRELPEGSLTELAAGESRLCDVGVPSSRRAA